MKKLILLLPVMLLFICFSIFPQENEPSESTEESNYDNDSVFVIDSFVFDVDGITLPFVMINKAELKKGEEIAGLANLTKYIEDKQQLLVNERVLESVSIEHYIGQQREDGKYPVALVIHVKDTLNIMAIPRPQYSSNSGFDITIKARDYNFLGTMNALRLDLGYQYDEEGRNFFTFMLDSGIPFEAFGLNWELDFDHFFNYRPDMEQPFYYKNITGLSVELPIKQTTLNIGFEESLFYNEENSEGDWPLNGKFQDGIYMSSYPYISWKIPTGLEISEYGELTYTPRFSARFNHELSQWPLDQIRKGAFLYFSHSLGFGRTDWIGNFRKGYSFSVSNSFDYSFYSKSIGSEPLSAYYNITGKGYFIVSDFFGISSRIIFRNWINTASDNGGDVLRGVMDNALYTDYMLSLNLDLTFRVLEFRPSEWFKTQKMRYFNFDLHLGPIIDAAFSHDPRTGTVYGFNRLNVTGGLEMIIYPTSFRSLYLRISAATDVYRMVVSERCPIEIFIGTELHY
jgi:hypothetical protein